MKRARAARYPEFRTSRLEAKSESGARVRGPRSEVGTSQVSTGSTLEHRVRNATEWRVSSPRELVSTGLLGTVIQHAATSNNNATNW